VPLAVESELGFEFALERVNSNLQKQLYWNSSRRNRKETPGRQMPEIND